MKIEADVIVKTNESEWLGNPDREGMMYDVWGEWERNNIDRDGSCLPSEVADRAYENLVPEFEEWGDDIYRYTYTDSNMLDGVAEKLKGVCTEITDVEIDYGADAIKAHVVLDEDAIREIEEEHDEYYDEEGLTAENVSEYLSKTYGLDDGVHKDWQYELAHDSLYDSVGGTHIDAKWLLSKWKGSNEESDLMDKAQEIAEEKDLDWEDVFEEMFPAAYEKFESENARD